MIPVIKKPDGTFACGPEEDREPEVGELYVEGDIVWFREYNGDEEDEDDVCSSSEHVGEVEVSGELHLDVRGKKAFEAWEAKKLDEVERNAKDSALKGYTAKEILEANTCHVPVPFWSTSLLPYIRKGMTDDEFAEKFRKAIDKELKRRDCTEDYQTRKRSFPKSFPKMRSSIVSVQPMTAPTGKIFSLDFSYRASTVENYQCSTINDVEQDKHAIAFDAVEEDRKKNGTRFDQLIEIECPICKGVLTYGVSSYNGHRSADCKDCGIAVME